jgi:DNA-binding HxlR family transcriptional regulator
MRRAAKTPVSCPMDRVLRTIMGQWSTYILWLLQNHDVLRFGQIKAMMPGISAKVLTERLRHLEASGLISRDYKPTMPPTVSYALTPRGQELKAALASISAIAMKWDVEDGVVGMSKSLESIEDSTTEIITA